MYLVLKNMWNMGNMGNIVDFAVLSVCISVKTDNTKKGIKNPIKIRTHRNYLMVGMLMLDF